MKYLILAFLALTACGAKQSSDPDINLQFTGTANSFVQTEKKAFNGQAAIETSLVSIRGQLVAFFDPTASGQMDRANLDGSNQVTVISSGLARFSYVMTYSNLLYAFVTRNRDVYELTSADDGFTWVEQGKVISHSDDPNSIYYNIWNVGVDVDDTGAWHMLIECANASGTAQSVGLGYATGALADLDNNKSAAQVIQSAGNPFVKFVPGKGILAIYGTFKGVWSTTAATFDGTAWMPHEDKFMISAEGYHICDPHAAETAEGLLLTVSVNQNSIYKTESLDETFASLYDKLL